MTPATGTRKSKNGTLYALRQDVDFDRKPVATYGVWVLRQNYDGKVHGGMRNTWRYLAKGLEYAAARALIERKTKH